MSLLNVWHGPDSVTIGVDSLGSGLAQPVTLSKAIYLPGHRAAVAARGAHVVFAMLTASLMLDVGGSVDALRAILPAQLETAWRAHRQILGAGEVGAEAAEALAGQDVVLAGWSSTAGRFVSVVFTIRGDGPCDWFELGDRGEAEYFCASWDDDSGELPDCATDSERLGAMRVQVAADRKRRGHLARSGGELWLVTLTHDGVRMTAAPA